MVVVIVHYFIQKIFLLAMTIALLPVFFHLLYMILCITHSQDTYNIDLVQQRLGQSGHASFRFNSDEFGTRYRLRYRLGADGPLYELICGDAVLSSTQVTGVWYRKLWNLQTPPSLDQRYVPVFLKEYHTSLRIFLDSLDVPWMNPVNIDHAVGGNKMLQLAFAQRSGLHVPQTLFSNHAEDAMKFYDACNGDVVIKLHGSLSRSMEGNGDFFPTTRLRKENVAQLEALAACPMILQEYIPKARELRVVYVDGIFYTGSLQAPESTDWRASTTVIQWEPYELPSDVEEKIDHMMRQLGLLFGAIDMIVHPDGRHFFLEVNPQGEWGMLQRYLELPIAETIADKLVDRIRKH